MQDLGPNSTDQSSSKNPPPKGDNEPANERGYFKLVSGTADRCLKLKMKRPALCQTSAAPVVKPAKTSKSKSTTYSDFVFPKKTIKNPSALVEKKDINTNNSFEALDSEMTDVEGSHPSF
ncbi:hypothetical protein TNCV_1836221 [Trichonephila clavipes]|nr:hypothetical protein TNCV_1836221 [Trichonephila clavipes]